MYYLSFKFLVVMKLNINFSNYAIARKLLKMASKEPTSTLQVPRDTLSTHVDSAEPGFIVIDLETDGLITESKIMGEDLYIPQILQIGFAPLEKLAHPMNTVSFYTQPTDPGAFRNTLKKCAYLQKFYTNYSHGCYYLKSETGLAKRVEAVSLDEGASKLVLWKKKIYKDRRVYFVAHNALRFDKLILDFQLDNLNLLESFISQMNFAGWIDSLPTIRSIPNVLQVLRHPCPADMTESAKLWFIKKEKPFTLDKLVQMLARRYSELSDAKLQWPIFDLPQLGRGEEEEKWLHYFSRDAMIHTSRMLLKKLTLHRSCDDVMALICIIHHLNLYPKFLKATSQST